LCAAVVMLAGFGGEQALASQQAPAGQVTSLSQAGSAGTWQAENSDTRHGLYDVACLSALRCEAVGRAGTIVFTADGGRIWRQQANPLRGSSTTLYQITCIAPSSCYVIARPDTILVTHNSGATWSRHVLPVGTDVTDQACLSFSPIAGQYSACRLGLLDISCVSASVCYAVAAAPLAYDVNPLPKTHAASASSWLTRDGGAKWTRQSIPAGVACNADCQSGLYGYPLEWVTCVSSGACRAGGLQFLSCGHCGFAYAVLATRGPGRAWSCVQSSAMCTGLAPDVATCPTSTRCYGVQSTEPFNEGDNTVFRSTDGGNGWTQVGPTWTRSVLNDITCPDTLTCYLAGTHGSIARITNGTTLAAQRTPTARNLYGIACVGRYPNTTCYAVGDGGTLLALR
jgi:Photosynthesis system II assembly factor YCF48